ncbi:post-GPI attachment to proteins factor 3-like isoform X3 [Ananas comosus]|uniref:Post-GPI attachment to proteins factor 3 n=1 Tax=Ananas comosus TaxID=4615 RepID=A0A6P5FNY5_ANACO|nr:post-GPI attachment to proteins factor 3-like isoform X2 [Ananas comosus]XP_020094811.1 post-GPI attachment to proteins factor 3-like isoform X3 [Ananas comosus]
MGERSLLLLFVLGCAFGAIRASEGEADPLYITCTNQCEKTGTLQDVSIQHCQVSSDSLLPNNPWYKQEPLYLRWKELNCKSECRYHCILQRENERESLGLRPVKYHGRWPFKRVFVFQEPLSAVLSALTLLIHFNGWLSFVLLLYYKLPLRPASGRTYYEFTGLWHIHGLLSMNAWFWSAIYHSSVSDLTEKLYHSSNAALVGYSLILAVLRTFNVKDEASRVMVAAPLLAFLTTHILYLNFYELDYGLNMKVCLAIGIAQMLLWAVWSVVTRHPSSIKLWVIAIGATLAVLLEISDFPPYKGYVDAHSLTHAIVLPLSFLWWSFVKDDAEFRTAALTKKMSFC